MWDFMIFGSRSGFGAIVSERYTNKLRLIYVDRVWNSLMSCTFIEVEKIVFLNTEGYV
jgi:hypothetical protein